MIPNFWTFTPKFRPRHLWHLVILILLLVSVLNYTLFRLGSFCTNFVTIYSQQTKDVSQIILITFQKLYYRITFCINIKRWYIVSWNISSDIICNNGNELITISFWDLIWRSFSWWSSTTYYGIIGNAIITYAEVWSIRKKFEVFAKGWWLRKKKDGWI